MPNYQLGKIYRLYAGDKQYIGSTTQPYLSTRLAIHKSCYKTWLKTGNNYVTSYELFELGEPQIELIELRMREGKWIRQMDCVNRRNEGRTYKEWYADNAEKYEDYDHNNADKKEHIKAYRAEKKTHPLNFAYVQKWRETNREVYLKQQREYAHRSYIYKRAITELREIDPSILF